MKKAAILNSPCVQQTYEHLCGLGDGALLPSSAVLGANIGYGRSTLELALTTLRRNGWIITERAGNVRRLLLPEHCREVLKLSDPLLTVTLLPMQPKMQVTG